MRIFVQDSAAYIFVGGVTVNHKQPEVWGF